MNSITSSSVTIQTGGDAPPPPALVFHRFSMTLSIRPYSRASWAVMKLSRSQSAVTSSMALAGVLGQDAVHPLLDHLQPLQVDGHVGDLALGAGGGLVDHDLRVGQGQTLALGPGGQQEGAHAGGQPMQMVDTSHLTYCMVS